MPAAGPVRGEESVTLGLRKFPVLTLVLGRPDILFLFYQIPSLLSVDPAECCLQTLLAVVKFLSCSLATGHAHELYRKGKGICEWLEVRSPGRRTVPVMLRDTVSQCLLYIEETYIWHL